MWALSKSEVALPDKMDLVDCSGLPNVVAWQALNNMRRAHVLYFTGVEKPSPWLIFR
jgi:hypothetical protein